MIEYRPLPRLDIEAIESAQSEIIPLIDAIMLKRASGNAFHQAIDAAGGATWGRAPAVDALIKAAFDMREDAIRLAVELAGIVFLRMADCEPECAKGAEGEPPDAA